MRQPPNDDCEWYDPRSGPLDLNRSADRSHLIQDVETAEELAVRSMDAHHQGTGPRDAKSAWNQCFVKLATAISTSHQLSPAQFMSEFGRRPAGVDLAVGIA